MSNLDKKKKRIPKQVINIIPPTTTPSHYESPKRNPILRTIEFKSTALMKSPFSKMVQELDPLLNPIFSKTPKRALHDEIIQFRTPDHRESLVEMRMAEKLDFDSLVGSGRKALDIIQGDISKDQVEQDSNQYSYYSEEQQPEHIAQKQQIPAQIIANKYQQLQFDEVINPTQTKNKPTDPTTKICCNCKKSRCLKLYCQCFRNNQICSGCNCVDCLNTSQNCPQRFNAYANAMQSNPFAFQPKIQSEKHIKGCNCKKSNCQKRYCECFQAGLNCTQLCRCEQCKNKTPCHKHKKPSNKPKIQIPSSQIYQNKVSSLKFTPTQPISMKSNQTKINFPQQNISNQRVQTQLKQIVLK